MRSMPVRPLAPWFIVAVSCAVASAQSIEVVSVADDGTLADADSRAASLSDDGNLVAFASAATNLVASDGNGSTDVFVRDRAAGRTIRVSVSSSGGEGDADSRAPSLSADGRFVAFESDASDLVAGDDGLWSDVFVHDLATGATTRVSVSSGGMAGNRDSFAPRLSADGRFVVFASFASNLVAGDTNGAEDVFVHDRQTGTTIRASVATSGGEGDDGSFEPAISRDGRFVAFSSFATDLDANDGDDVSDVCVRDLVAGTTTLASVAGDGSKGDDESFGPSISDDGARVAFSSYASNLVAGDTAGTLDLFLRDLAAGTTGAGDVDSAGGFGANEISQSAAASLSGDARFVAFSAPDGTLVPKDSNHWDDELVHDFATPLTSRVNVAADGTQADGPSEGSQLSGDGRFVVFASSASTLVPGVGNGALQVYLRERRLDDAASSSYGAGWPGTHGIPTLSATSAPVINRATSLAIGNSLGKWTFGLLLLGVTQIQQPTSWGGELLVDPLVAAVIALPPAGAAFQGDVPPDESLVGAQLFGQVLEIDGGASRGISFTAGLELDLGY
jgi:Tol biopolymer transport system component